MSESKKKLYRIVAIVVADFYGETPEKAVDNMQGQAETMDSENWIVLQVREVSVK